MFDIGFSELMVIGVVALVVIGPERLPKVARTAGALFGRMQRYVADVKADINREIEASELKDLKKTMTDAAQSFEQSVKSHADDIQTEMRKTEEEFNRLSNPMMHFGLAGGAAATTTSAETPAHPGDAEPSPQLELGLAGAPATSSEPTAQPASASAQTAAHS
ncbi:MAG: Sec-independent protein translocase protein TatB [Burkholderiales bacterium]|nr:Sec-independent protein translocase protein TatB [Burkholderiales bacterium]